MDYLMRNDCAKHIREVHRILLKGNEPEPESREVKRLWGWAIALGVVLLALCLMGGCAQAYSLDTWADCIRITEGNPNYGILSVKTHNPRQVCKNTVLHAWRDYRGNKADLRAFVGFLADRYCPFSVDPVGNRNWKRNMLTLLRRIK